MAWDNALKKFIHCLSEIQMNWASHTLYEKSDTASRRIFLHGLDVHIPPSKLESQGSRNGEL